MEAQLQQEKLEIHRINELMKMRTSESQVFEKINQEKKQLEHQIAEYERKFSALKAEVTASRETISKFNEHRIRKDKEIGTLKDELNEMTIKMEQMKLDTRRSGDETSLNSLRSSLERQENENIRLNTMLQAITAENGDLTAWKEQVI